MTFLPPTPWQQKVMWSALTGLALYAIAKLAIYVISAVGGALNQLQPLLIPVAVAAIPAYLLDPIVEKFCAAVIKRTPAVFYVLALVCLPLVATGSRV